MLSQISSRTRHFLDNVNAIDSKNARDILSKIYTEDVVFIDPVKEIQGLDSLSVYFEKLYQKVNLCRFDVTTSLMSDQHESLQWVMHLQHAKIKNGRDIYLDGASFLKYRTDKICYQKDYYDLGALIYEQIPILGSVVKKVRHAI